MLLKFITLESELEPLGKNKHLRILWWNTLASRGDCSIFASVYQEL